MKIKGISDDCRTEGCIFLEDIPSRKASFHSWHIRYFCEKYTFSCIFLSALTKNDHFTVGY